jgi:spermidine synthase
MSVVMSPDRRLYELLGDVLASGGGLDRFLEESAQQANVPLDELISTDQSLYLEYATPRGNVLPWSTRNILIANLLRFRDDQAIAGMLTP